MCGIACLINNNGAYTPEMLSRFTDAVSHRGPDGRGVAFFGPDGGRIANSADFRLGLGHRRLSIIDLSESGSQPMEYDGGNYVIVYNGEIYNYVEIRAELEKEGYSFSSHCDTEVLLAAYKKWGVNCLSRLNGMWAFAIYDRAAEKLFVSRDRIGIKPLYWRVNGNNLALASEIKQFFCLPDFSREMNPASSVLYLATGYENHPETFYDGVFAFPPGHFAEINPEKPQVSPERFWFPEKISVSCSGDEDFSRAIRETFSDSVRIRLRSDVTVGGCLSGGLDSSSIFLMMKEHAPETTFNAFSACFRNFESDESPFMDLVCRKTGSRHIKEFPDPFPP